MTLSSLPEVDRFAGTLIVVAIAAISSRNYRHKGKPYSEGKRPAAQSLRSFRFVYFFIRVMAFAGTIGGIWFGDPIFLDLYHSQALFFCGLVVAVLGISLFLYAKHTLGRQYSPCFDSYLPNEVTMSGPYRYVRHPLYTANLLLLSGLFVMSGSGWTLTTICIVGAYYVHAAAQEESDLSRHFSAYRTYLRDTGRFLPRLKIKSAIVSGTRSDAERGDLWKS
jgi:protein-S-isoprenylcysteine O-methyltransferase Ste14